MQFLPSALLALTVHAANCEAARLSVAIAGSQLLPNPASLSASTHAVLVGPPGVRFDVPLRRDSTLVFSDLPEASYLLTVHARDYLFAPLRVDVSKPADDAKAPLVEAWQTFRGNDWNNKGSHYGSGEGELQIQIRPAAPKAYYQARGGFNLLGFLKSPMILMALVSMGLVFGLPYLMENMDHETRAEFEEMQRKGPITGQQGAAAQMQNFDFASWMAGRSDDSKRS